MVKFPSWYFAGVMELADVLDSKSASSDSLDPSKTLGFYRVLKIGNFAFFKTTSKTTSNFQVFSEALCKKHSLQLQKKYI